MKKTKFELKRQLKREKNILLKAIQLQCYSCQGYMADGYSDCKLYSCPLYPYKLTRGYSRNKEFMRLAQTLRKIYETHTAIKPSFWKDKLENK